MSGLVMGLVFELPIAENFGRPEKFVLLAYADHADQNGRNIYPSVDLIVQKTGYRERAVQMITRNLEQSGFLVDDGIGPHGTNRWRIPLQRTQQGAKIAPLPMSLIAPEEIAPEEIAPEPSVESLTTTTTTVIDERFGILVRELEGVTGAVNTSMVNTLTTWLELWQEHVVNIPFGHPNKAVDPYTAVLGAIREGINSAKDRRPSNNYIQAILERWMREGYKTKRSTHDDNRSGNSKRAKQPGPEKAGAAEYSADDLAAAERINARV